MAEVRPHFDLDLTVEIRRKEDGWYAAANGSHDKFPQALVTLIGGGTGAARPLHIFKIPEREGPLGLTTTEVLPGKWESLAPLAIPDR